MVRLRTVNWEGCGRSGRGIF